MAKKRNKLFRIRWGRIAVLALIIIGLPLFIIHRCGNHIKDTFTNTTDSVRELTPYDLRCDSIVKQRIDSFVNSPQRLDRKLIAISVTDLTDGLPVYQYNADDTLPPASCLKVATAIVAIKTLGINHRYYESLQIKGDVKGGVLRGNLILRADADPLFLSLDTLVKQVKRKGINHIEGNVYVNLELEERLVGHPSAKTWDIPYNKLPVLLKGKTFVRNSLIASLRTNGITFRQNDSVRIAGKYRIIARTSNPLREAVAQMIIHSSNIKAEAILFHLDSKTGTVTDRKQHWDITHYMQRCLNHEFRTDSMQLSRFTINDGSGLSPYNRMSTNFLVRMLEYSYNDATLRDYFINEAFATPGTPVRRGSLLTRFMRPEYHNRIFVKTGTLTTIGSSSLTGYIKGSDKRWYAFAIINKDSPVAESRIFQDKLCKAIMKQ